MTPLPPASHPSHCPVPPPTWLWPWQEPFNRPSERCQVSWALPTGEELLSFQGGGVSGRIQNMKLHPESQSERLQRPVGIHFQLAPSGLRAAG